MTIRDAIYKHLTEHAGLAALVAARIFPGAADQNCGTPYVIFGLAGGQRMRCNAADPGLAPRRLRTTSWADTPEEADAVAEQIRAALNYYRGTMGGAGGVVIQRIYPDFEPVDEFDPGTARHAVIQDWLLWAEG